MSITLRSTLLAMLAASSASIGCATTNASTMRCYSLTSPSRGDHGGNVDIIRADDLAFDLAVAATPQPGCYAGSASVRIDHAHASSDDDTERSRSGDLFGVVTPFHERPQRTARGTDIPMLVAEREMRGRRVEVRLPCVVDGDAACGDGDVRWWEAHEVEAPITLRADLEAMARGGLQVVFDPNDGRGGLGARFSPLMRRVASSGMGIGLGLGYFDLGVRQRFTVAAVFEYDLTQPFRDELGGRARTWQLVLGVEIGLGIAALPSALGQSLRFGGSVDPYLELRIAPIDGASSVSVPIRIAAPLFLGAETRGVLTASIGLAIGWDE